MKSICVNLHDTPSELHEGLKILSGLVPLSFKSIGGKQFAVEFIRGNEGPVIVKGETGFVVHYKSLNQAYRAVGLMVAALCKDGKISPVKEKQRFDSLNMMLDVSRNAVMTVEALKEYLARLALMGLNSFMLYNETAYEVAGEPYFGYNLGAYSKKELMELDRYAATLGIEMFPCIQTLAHLKRILQYQVYKKVKDTETVLLVDEPETYALIEKMIKAAVAPFKSNKVHIGMDEAWDLGLGSYLKQNGYRSPHELIARHFPKVRAMLKKMGLRPIMWGDMYFRPLSKTGDYRDPAIKSLPPNLKKQVPQEIQLVDWDYYTFDKERYREHLRLHQSLNPDTSMAPGVQTWGRFWSNYPYAKATIVPALEVSLEEGVRDIIMTAWGDDGNECDHFSAMPMLQYYADFAFNGQFSETRLADNLMGSCGVLYKEWSAAGRIDTPPKFTNLNGNPSKHLLWEDPVYGITQADLNGISLNNYYQGIYNELATSLKRNAKGFNSRLLLPAQLCRVLSVKADFPSRLKKAYQKKDKKKLKELINRDLPFIRREVEKLYRVHKESWSRNYKIQGWNILEQRYGGLILRIESVMERLSAYLSRDIESLPELEGKTLRLLPDNQKGRLAEHWYQACYGNNPCPIN